MTSHSASTTLAFASLLGLFAVSSLVFTCTLVEFTWIHRNLVSSASASTTSFACMQPRARHDHDYTYVDDDFPPQLPDFDPGYVQMAVEESVRFSIWDPEGPGEWSSTSPPGEGSVRLGPDDRLFYLSMFHELHCLRRLEKLLRDPQLAVYPGALGHAQHCLNYLRQLSLCRADRMLEIGDFVERNFTMDRVGPVHICRDWSAVYDHVTFDWSRWKDAAPKFNSDKFGGRS